MKENLTEIVVLLDKSGSMEAVTDDTIGGYNAFIDEQKRVPGEAVLTTVLFSTDYTVLHERADIQKVNKITPSEYKAGGNTALLDALGKTINDIGAKLSNTREEERPSKVIFFIITDGKENSSREFTQECVKAMVELQKNTYNWEFIFMGANIDSFSEAASIGIGHDRAFNYEASRLGARSSHRAMSMASSNFRMRGSVDVGEDFRAELAADTPLIIGAIAGDIIGSVYEWHNVKTTTFKLFTRKSTFTDDSVLTFATMDSILHNVPYTKVYQQYGSEYSDRGYGGTFRLWIHDPDPAPYNSWGNGSAMRVSPVGWAYQSLEETLAQAKASAEVTHNHPEGIKGAQATAAAIFLARTNAGKEAIKTYIVKEFGYDLQRTLDEIRPHYHFDVSAQGSVPEAIIAFLESTDYESAIRLAVSIGGDSDTIACITGGIAEAFYRTVPEDIVNRVVAYLPAKIVSLIEEFSRKYRQRT
ncbi:hypothetical protein FACS1894200_04660 [Spirochaetia bacterium]|nr:hypothetical protein FACS1894200_04660 [Spirochaetia bacterium]